MPTQSTAETTLFDSIAESVRKWFHPPTRGKKTERDRRLKNLALFAFSTVALIALQDKISKVISIDEASKVAQAKF